MQHILELASYALGGIEVLVVLILGPCMLWSLYKNDIGSDRYWEEMRKSIDGHLAPLQGASVVLTTYYAAPSERVGRGMADWLRKRWPEQVAVQEYSYFHHHGWVVIVTTGAVTVTELLPRQWLARMRLVYQSSRRPLAGLSIVTEGDQVPPPTALAFHP